MPAIVVNVPDGAFFNDVPVGVVFETSNYSKFKKLKANRSVTKSRKDTIKASMASGYLMSPILVNDELEVIDGQGRLTAEEELDIPCHYIVQSGIGIEDCQRMNKCNMSWTNNDFIESYAVSGNENFIRIKEVIDVTGLTANQTLRFAGLCVSGGKNLIESGELIFTDEHKDKVMVMNKMASDIKAALCYETKPNDTFYASVTVMFEWPGYNHKKMVDNCRVNRHTYAQMSRMRDMLCEFSRIYNYGKQKQNRVDFSSYLDNKGYSVRSYDMSFTNRDSSDVSIFTKIEVCEEC